MKVKDLDRIFDEGEVDVNDYLDLTKAFKPGQEHRRVNVDFPSWMVRRLDKESSRLGVPRQSLIKVWIAERLERPHEFQGSAQGRRKAPRAGVVEK